jgi:multidrug efflux system membrane fusion protein
MPLSNFNVLFVDDDSALRAFLRGLPRYVGSVARLSAVGAFCALTSAACNASKNAYVPPPPPKVAVAQPVQKPVTLYVELTGNTAPFNQVTLVARVQGYLQSIDYKDGAYVTKGTQLFGIERDVYQAQLDQQKATLASNKATEVYDRWQYDQQATLFKQDSTARSTLEQWKSSADQASAAILNAQAAIDLANINLGYTRVLAPFDGVVTNHQADLGALVGVSSPTTLATIIQTDPLYVYFTVSEPQVLAIRKSSAEAGRPISSTDLSRLSTVPVEIGLQDEEGYPHQGHLDYASPQVDTATGTLAARALFDNKDHGLLSGLFVRVRLPIGHRDNALLTPNDAIGTSQEGSYLLVVGADNVVHRKIVKTGDREGELRVIESGLDPTDWVVTEGIQRAFPGAKVDPQRAAATPAAATPPEPAAK